MKKFLAIIAAMTMVFCFTACGSSDQSQENAEPEMSEEEMITGGWEIAEDPAPAVLPEDVNAAFENYMKNYDDELIPMAYFGKQIVAGTNYELLCKSTNDNELQTVVLQQNLNGNVDGAIVNTFQIADYTEGDGAEASSEQLSGGWEIPDDYAKAEIPEDAYAAFTDAAAELDGCELTPMALLGTQVVSGTNYAFLCHSTTVTDPPVQSIQVVTVYKNLFDESEITNICTLDLASFNE